MFVKILAIVGFLSLIWLVFLAGEAIKSGVAPSMVHFVIIAGAAVLGSAQHMAKELQR